MLIIIVCCCFLQHRVQRKRFNELERAKKAEILERLKAERDLSNEIISTLKLSATGGFDAKASLTKKSSVSLCGIFAPL